VTSAPELKLLPPGARPLLLPAGPIKPKLRGVLHEYGFFISLVSGVALILGAPAGRARLAAGVFAGAASALLGTSALYHRIDWRPSLRRWMRRLDHAMIFVLIAATYTPVALVALSGALPRAILIAVWAGALLGVVLKLIWIDAPKWLFALIYVVLGWTTAAVAGELPGAIGWLGAGGFLLGGILYTVGAFIYAARRPDPAPRTFGYHELFHSLVLAALALHYAVIAFLVLPRA
jgi:hemolysin III